jgi:hypothetical protein
MYDNIDTEREVNSMRNIVMENLKAFFEDEIKYLEQSFQANLDWVSEPKILVDCCRSRCLGATLFAESFKDVNTHDVELMFSDYKNKMYKIYRTYKRERGE